MTWSLSDILTEAFWGIIFLAALFVLVEASLFIPILVGVYVRVGPRNLIKKVWVWLGED